MSLRWPTFAAALLFVACSASPSNDPPTVINEVPNGGRGGHAGASHVTGGTAAGDDVGDDDGDDEGGAGSGGAIHTGGTTSLPGGHAGSGGAAPAPVCGNGTLEGSEACDGMDFGGKDCAAVLGRADVSGILHCSGCKIDASGCTVNPKCGDGKINQANEQCDGSDVGDATCKSTAGPTFGGVVGCTADCMIDTGGCVAGGACNDGTLDAGEDCDGSDVGMATCATVLMDPNMGGLLGCGADCKLDTSNCTPNPVCGDGKRNSAAEDCDGTDLGGQGCKTVLADTHAVGDLACDPTTCKFDLGGCSVPPYCGNGVKDAADACDGTDFGGATCASLLGDGYGGNLACGADCTIDQSDCHVLPVCGDGVLNQTTERCDGADVAGLSCAQVVGFGSTGTLGCQANCQFDVTQCSAEMLCGNGVVDGTPDMKESCDGSDFAGQSCATLLGNGHATGTLACTDKCSIDASACTIPLYCGDGKPGPNEDCDDPTDARCVNCTFTCKAGEGKYVDPTGRTHCFFSDKTKVAWDTGNTNCVNAGAHAATVASDAENHVIWDNFLDCNGACPNDVWLGLNDKATEGTFAWSDGEAVSYTHWNTGEPNNGGGNEDCVEELWTPAERWADRDCSLKFWFICEAEPRFATP